MKVLSKLFGEINLTWLKVIVFAVITAIYTALINQVPSLVDTSFQDIAISFEWWILFGIIIIMNSKSNLDSALKCFAFFLISQPLIYLIEVPFLGWSIMGYYKNWIIWTIVTLPMGYLGYYMKKDKWWGLIFLIPMLIFLGTHYSEYLGKAMFSFPKHILTTLFCALTSIIYPIAIFKDKRIKIAGIIISFTIIIVMTVITLVSPTVYETDILSSGGALGITFDNDYKVYLKDKEYGDVFIRYEDAFEDYVIRAKFIKEGKTEVILESPSGEKTIFDIDIKNDKYDITVKSENKSVNKNEVSKMKGLQIKVNNQVLNVELEDNSSVDAFLDKLKDGDITVNTHDYGGFEKVGDLGFNLPTNDRQITTEPGDLILYQGNQITLYYGTNTWSFTKLGKVKNTTKEELQQILGSGKVNLVFTLK